MNHLAYGWINTRSLCIRWTTVVATILTTLTVSALGLIRSLDRWPGIHSEPWDPTANSLTSIVVGSLLIGALGATLVTDEYTTRMIRSSLSIAPRRSVLLTAKAGITVLIALGVSLTTITASFVTSQAVIATTTLSAAVLSDPEVIRTLLCAGAYPTLTALLDLAFGAFTRLSTGALAILVAVALLAPSLTHTLPSGLEERITAYWPFPAGQSAHQLTDSASIPPLVGIGIMALCTIYATVAPHLVVRSRDG